MSEIALPFWWYAAVKTSCRIFLGTVKCQHRSGTGPDSFGRMIEPRLLSGSDAAAYCGVTPATFSKWVATGIAPKPLPGTRRWDRKAIDLAIDKVSGIKPPPAEPEEDEFTKWKRGYDARKTAARGGAR
jgi:hypothetical protein